MEFNIQNQNISVKFNSLGAEIQSIIKDDYNYIWTIDAQYWNKTSPVLFPIVGSLRNNSYTLYDKKYTLARHGFARDYDFNINQRTDSSITFSLVQNETTLAKYPFEFELQITYTLEKNKLIILYCITNNAAGKMPFNIGGHPAFTIDKPFDDYSLLFEKEGQLITHELQDGLLSGNASTISLIENRLPLSYSLFEKDALIFKNINSNFVTLYRKDDPILRIEMKNFPHLGVWTKKNGSFLCIEPWLGYTDSTTSNGDIFQKESIQILAPKASFTSSFTIEII
jgi:galactose mutarotase-like enzyme